MLHLIPQWNNLNDKSVLIFNENFSMLDCVKTSVDWITNFSLHLYIIKLILLILAGLSLLIWNLSLKLSIPSIRTFRSNKCNLCGIPVSLTNNRAFGDWNLVPWTFGGDWNLVPLTNNKAFGDWNLVPWNNGYPSLPSSWFCGGLNAFTVFSAL